MYHCSDLCALLLHPRSLCAEELCLSPHATEEQPSLLTVPCKSGHQLRHAALTKDQLLVQRDFRKRNQIAGLLYFI